MAEERQCNGAFRILTLDGGGAKGFYTLGVLKEIEAMLGHPLYKRFDLVFGTSTGQSLLLLSHLGMKLIRFMTCIKSTSQKLCPKNLQQQRQLL